MQKAPKVLILAVLAHGLLLYWLWWHGFPRPTSDTIAFKQPAYMRLHTPFFSIPSYEGTCPHFDKVASYPACVYTYLNYLVFRTVGFSLSSTLGTDLVIHFAGSTLAAFCIWRLSRSDILASLFVGASLGWLMPIGRPEELGMLFVVIALIGIRSRFWIGAAIALGLTGATTPGAAIVGTILTLAYDGIFSHWSRPYLLRAITVLIVAPLLSLVLYTAFMWPYVAEAFEQHRYLMDSNFYFWTSPRQLVGEARLQAVALFGLVITALAFCGWTLRRRVDVSPEREMVVALLKASGVAIIVGLALNLGIGRRMYDYRLLTAISVAVICMGSSLLQSLYYSQRRMIAVVSGLILIAFTAPSLRDVTRYAVAGYLWSDDSVNYAEAVQVVRHVVPATASLGGGGETWTVVGDGRPYIATRFVDEGHWPDYLISATWSNPPSLLEDKSFRKTIEDSYEEVTPAPQRPQNGCFVSLLGVKIPVARGRCDWYLRIWRRRDLPQRSMPIQSDDAASSAPKASGK